MQFRTFATGLIIVLAMAAGALLLSDRTPEASDDALLQLLGDGGELPRILPETLDCVETVAGTNAATSGSDVRPEDCRQMLRRRLDDPAANIAGLRLRDLEHRDLTGRILNIANKQEALFKEQGFATEAAARLEAASLWLLRQGVDAPPVRDQAALDEALLGMGTNLWVSPVIPEDGAFALFRLKSRGINRDLMLLQKIDRDGVTFEQWAAPISGREWAGVNYDYRFYLVRAVADDAREILAQGDQFAEVFLAEGTQVRFDMQDLWVRYRLSAWEFPAHFVGTDLAETEVYYTEAGTLAERPAR